MDGEGEGEDRLLSERMDRRHVVRKEGAERLARLQRRVGRGQLGRAVQGEQHLRLGRLLAPQRAVVVEDGDPLRRRHEIRAAFGGHRGDEVENGVQFALQMRNVFFGDGNARQARNTLHRGGVDRHEALGLRENTEWRGSIMPKLGGATADPRPARA